MTIPTMTDFLLGLAGAPTAQGGNGSGFSNLTTSEVGSGIPDGADRLTDAALFVQDDWKVNSRLTLNLGLRWEYIGWPVDAFGRRGDFYYSLYQAPPPNGSTSSGFVQSNDSRDPLPGLPMVNPTVINHAPDKNFAPRFGLAYKLTEKLVMRGGYGIFYDQLSNQLGLLESQSPPNYVRTILTPNAQNAAATLQVNPFPTLAAEHAVPHSAGALWHQQHQSAAGLERGGPNSAHAIC